MVSKEVGHSAQDWKMQNEGWDKVKKEVEPLKANRRSDLRAVTSTWQEIVEF